MVKNADKSNVDSTSISDKRITKIGSKIRKYKIDELPQLFNIFLGDMSFVGQGQMLVEKLIYIQILNINF